MQCRWERSLFRRTILRMMRRERHLGSQLNGRDDEPLSAVVHHAAMSRELRSIPCPVGDGRMRAPLAVSANGGSAERH